MDDLTLGGPSDVVAADLDYISSIQDDTGLCINASKSEIISRGSRPRTAQFEGFISVAPEEAELLGAISRLTLLSAHDALILLQMSFSAPKMLHTLRCSPCVNHPRLAMFDSLFRKGIGTIS